MFHSETNDVNTGLLVEVWSKGMLWDRALGYHYIPLPGVSYASEVTVSTDVQQREQQQGKDAGNPGVALPLQPPLECYSQEREQALPHEPTTPYESDTLTDTNRNTQEYQFTDTVHSHSHTAWCRKAWLHLPIFALEKTPSFTL